MGRVRRPDTGLRRVRDELRDAERNAARRRRYRNDTEYRERLKLLARERIRDIRAAAAGLVDSKTLRCPVCEGLTRIARTRAYEKAIDRSRWCGSCRLEIRTTEVVVELVDHNAQPSDDGVLLEVAS